MLCNCDFVLEHKDGWEKHYDNCRTAWAERHKDRKYPKNEDATLRILNEHLLKLDVDILYHLGFDTKTNDLPSMFGDVKFVCMGGTKHRMRELAEYMTQVLSLTRKSGKLVNLTKHSKRYAMYKVGPVLCVSHGVGIPSMTTLLHEVIKLMCYAKAKDPIFFRIGTSGGLGIPAGSVVVSEFGLNGNLEKKYNLPILGKTQSMPSLLDKRVAQEVHFLSSKSEDFNTYLAGTMASDDFYQGQARLDGPFCDHSEEEKMEFLQKLVHLGVRNIEMEATAFSAFTRQAGVRGGIICVTLLDRLLGDQVTTSKSTLVDWEKRPMIVVGKYITKKCSQGINGI